jgi:hypothetical protein
MWPMCISREFVSFIYIIILSTKHVNQIWNTQFQNSKTRIAVFETRNISLTRRKAREDRTPKEKAAEKIARSGKPCSCAVLLWPLVCVQWCTWSLATTAWKIMLNEGGWHGAVQELIVDSVRKHCDVMCSRRSPRRIHGPRFSAVVSTGSAGVVVRCTTTHAPDAVFPSPASFRPRGLAAAPCLPFSTLLLHRFKTSSNRR